MLLGEEAVLEALAALSVEPEPFELLEGAVEDRR
jgi:hypothetical protein